MTVTTDVFETQTPRAYEDIRSELKNGDILLFSGVEPFSYLIRWATRSPWSHVGFVFRLEAIDRVMVLQAVTNAGASCVALSGLVNGVGSKQKPYRGGLLVARHADFEGLANAANLRAMSMFAVDRFGAPYSPGEIVKIAVRVIAGWLNKPMPKLLEADDEYICSEYAAACFERVGVIIPWDGLGFIAPADFASDAKVSPVGVIRTHG